MFLPILRTEFKSIETYEFNPKNNSLNSNFSVFYGVDDKTVDFEELSFWRKVTRKRC